LINDTTLITYTAQGASEEILVNILIFDLNNQPVKALVNNENRISGINSEVWDGSVDMTGGFGDNNGDGIADEGVYRFEIKIKNGSSPYRVG